MSTKVVANNKKIEKAETVRVNEKKWSKPLMDAGWTAIPTVLVEKQKALGLDPTDMNIILQLAAYWWTHDNKPHPSKKTIAAAMGVTPRTVQRRIARMEKDGLIRREERRITGKGSRTNKYHLDGLIKEAQHFAQKKTKKLAERNAERETAAARKGRTRLELVKSPDDEG